MKKKRTEGGILTKTHQSDFSGPLQDVEQEYTGKSSQLTWDSSVQFLVYLLKQILKGEKKIARNVFYFNTIVLNSVFWIILNDQHHSI